LGAGNRGEALAGNVSSRPGKDATKHGTEKEAILTNAKELQLCVPTNSFQIGSAKPEAIFTG
jgi:hypothetical protein